VRFRLGCELIEDACAYAWLELFVRLTERINPVGWLRVVAGREAVRLARHERSLLVLGERVPDPAGAADRRLEARAGLEGSLRSRHSNAPRWRRASRVTATPRSVRRSG
jgi:hypothetical protein